MSLRDILQQSYAVYRPQSSGGEQRYFDDAWGRNTTSPLQPNVFPPPGGVTGQMPQGYSGSLYTSPQEMVSGNQGSSTPVNTAAGTGAGFGNPTDLDNVNHWITLNDVVKAHANDPMITGMGLAKMAAGQAPMGSQMLGMGEAIYRAFTGNPMSQHELGKLGASLIGGPLGGAIKLGDWMRGTDYAKQHPIEVGSGLGYNSSISGPADLAYRMGASPAFIADIYSQGMNQANLGGAAFNRNIGRDMAQTFVDQLNQGGADPSMLGLGGSMLNAINAELDPQTRALMQSDPYYYEHLAQSMADSVKGRDAFNALDRELMDQYGLGYNSRGEAVTQASGQVYDPYADPNFTPDGVTRPNYDPYTDPNFTVDGVSYDNSSGGGDGGGGYNDPGSYDGGTDYPDRELKRGGRVRYAGGGDVKPKWGPGNWGAGWDHARFHAWMKNRRRNLGTSGEDDFARGGRVRYDDGGMVGLDFIEDSEGRRIRPYAQVMQDSEDELMRSQAALERTQRFLNPSFADEMPNEYLPDSATYLPPPPMPRPRPKARPKSQAKKASPKPRMSEKEITRQLNLRQLRYADGGKVSQLDDLLTLETGSARLRKIIDDAGGAENMPWKEITPKGRRAYTPSEYAREIMRNALSNKKQKRDWRTDPEGYQADLDHQVNMLLSDDDTNFARGGRVSGPGGGMDDLIPTTIEGRIPAALSNDEFVVPADVVSALGDGSSTQGHRKLYDLIKQVRTEKYGHGEQPPQLRRGLQALLNAAR